MYDWAKYNQVSFGLGWIKGEFNKDKILEGQREKVQVFFPSAY